MSDPSALATRFHPETAFGGFSDVDGTLIFYARVQELLGQRDVALDVGCGRGTQLQDPVLLRRDLRILQGKCSRLLGLDIDPGAAANPCVDEFRLITHGVWPVNDSLVDLVLADFVVEHLADPDQFFAEAARVTRPGGVICIRTINAWSYVGMASKLIPNRVHRPLLSRLQPERAPADVFPTFYRCNSVPRLRGMLVRHGFDATVYGVEAEPAYLGMSRVTYSMGLLHRRLAPSMFMTGIFAWGRRR